MVDMAALQGTISSLQFASKVLQAFRELSISLEVKTKVVELTEAILQAQTSALAAQSEQFAMVQRIRDLEEEVMRIKAWEEQKQRYQMVRPWSGVPALVYALKESCKGAEPAHWICAKCYDDGRRTVLQPRYDSRAYFYLLCPTCESQVISGLRGHLQPEFAKDL